ncbi:MAG: serine/threonine-protein phosphatase [Verrucomicrobia bacterium]|nr:serine/threonine-protein phosphatase [Verrucomicrobiota bacterium]
MGYIVESFGISDLGLARDTNEDVFHEIPIHRFFVLADGMGGHNAGEVAAKEAVHHLSTSICQIFSSEKKTPLPDLLHKAILGANSWVHQLSEQKEEFQGMGTTLCCLLLQDDHLICAHIGDSRIYRFRGHLNQITEDHRVSAPSNKKNMITKAIGTNPHVEPSISTLPIAPNDIYFLCSDGLTDYVSDEEISNILQNHICIKLASQELINQAKLKGGGDNITILMVKVLNET